MTATPATTGTGEGMALGPAMDLEPSQPRVAMADSGSDRAWFSPSVLLVLPALAIVGIGFAKAVDAGVTTADWIRLELTLGWAVAGVCVLVRPTLQPLGRLVALATCLGATSFAAAVIGTTAAGDTGHAARAAATVLPAVLMAVAIHVLLSVPDGRLVSRWRQIEVVFGYLAGLALGLWAWFGPGRMTDAVAITGWSIAVVVGSAAAVRRYRSVPGIDRQRLQTLAAGAVASVEVGLVVLGLAVLVGWPGQPWAIAAGGTVLVAIGMAAATFSRQLGRSDRMLVWLLTLTGLSAVVLAVYMLVILGFGHKPGSGDRQVLGLSILAAAIVALGASVSHQRVQEAAQRLVYGTNAVPDDVVKTFSTRLTRAVTMDELLLQLTESLRKSMSLTSAEVFTGTSEVLERSASIPDRGPGTLHIGPKEQPIVARAGVSGNAWTAVWLPAVIAGRDHAQLRVCPITYGGDLLGLVVVERPHTEPAFTEKEDIVLTELSRQVGLALHNVRLDSALQSTLDEVRRQAAELRASRSRIVAAADAERRRVERDLHDGAQQHLVALAVNVRLVRDLVVEDPEAAAEALDEIAVEVKATVQELRDLAHGIYPPLLMDNGLPEALRAVGSRSPLDVQTSVEGIGRFSADIEAAVYFCCLEALQNAAKHAPGSHVQLRVWEEEGGLLFTVTDDGPGFDPKVAQAGHGFMNMSDRLGAIGGSVRWESAPQDGSTVRGSIPLA
ncbi:MAG TPA: histidine kinase [Acidimicrobiales bacterium]|nr:histidine kinase [Acidimicrobiales bacterium]